MNELLAPRYPRAGVSDSGSCSSSDDLRQAQRGRGAVHHAVVAGEAQSGRRLPTKMPPPRMTGDGRARPTARMATSG